MRAEAIRGAWCEKPAATVPASRKLNEAQAFSCLSTDVGRSSGLDLERGRSPA